MNKKLPLLILVLFIINSFSYYTFSQNKKNIIIKGIVKDDSKNEIDAVPVILISSNNSVIDQTLTDSNGSFQLTSTEGACFQIVITYLGYEIYQSPIKKAEDFSSSNIAIELISKNYSLADIVVVGEKSKPIIESKNGKIIFNVQNSIDAQGSTAFEVLKKTPGVIVDGNNSISVNGRSGILITLNGKQTYMQNSELADLLKTISSSNLQSIEIMSNPSAMYDAAGSGGIININIRKEDLLGFNLSANNGMAYGQTLKQNTELRFDYQSDKINVSANYNHAFGHHKYEYGMLRLQNDKEYNTHTDDTDKRKTIAGSIGVDYKINKNHVVGVNLSVNTLTGPGKTDTETKISDPSINQLEQTLIAENDYYHQKANRYNTNLNYRFNDNEKHDFSIDIDYGYFDGGSGNLQPNTYYDANGLITNNYLYKSVNNRDIDLFAISANYKTLLWKGNLNTGLKYSYVSSDNNFSFYDIANGVETIDVESSNIFDYTEKIAAAFVQYDLSLSNKFSISGGLRVENTNSKGDLVPLTGSSQKPNTNKKDYTDLFPSVSITYKIDDKQQLMLSYGRRIDRPAYQDLNPFEYLLDELSYWKGNPFLEPQKTNRLTLHYQLNKTIIELSASQTNNFFTQITDTLGANKVIMIPKNLGKKQYIGLSIIQSARLAQGWNANITLSGNYLRNKIFLDEQRNFTLNRFSGSLSVQSSYKICWGIVADLFGVFNTKRLGGSNDIYKANSQVDLGLSKDFFRNKATLRLAFTDIYKGQNWDNKSGFDGLKLQNYGRGESRQIKLNFTYKFGGSNASKQENRDSNIESEMNRM